LCIFCGWMPRFEDKAIKLLRKTEPTTITPTLMLSKINSIYICPYYFSRNIYLYMYFLFFLLYLYICLYLILPYCYYEYVNLAHCRRVIAKKKKEGIKKSNGSHLSACMMGIQLMTLQKKWSQFCFYALDIYNQ
jgi:hypothetical protein